MASDPADTTVSCSPVVTGRRTIRSRVADAFAASWLYHAIGDHAWLASKSAFIEHCVRSPGGYYPLELIYSNKRLASGPLRRFADWFYLNSAMARAARLRLAAAVRWLRSSVERMLDGQETVRILDLPCGSARLLIETLRDQTWRERVVAVGIDHDPDALVFARTAAREAGIADLRLRRGNALKPSLDGEGRFDAIAMLGLLDYLSDRPARRVVDRVSDLLAPGGTLLFGMTSTNPSRRFFEKRLGWRLHYRSREEIQAFAATTRLSESATVADCNGCYVLVECRRPAD